MNIVIVESPAKAKTINRYLGSQYEVLASYGHVRDLPSKDGSVDPDKDFAMLWETERASAKRLNEIARAVRGADALYLATDPDREGEAISWHILEILKQKKVLDGVAIKRVAFNAITKSAVLKAMAEPRQINQELVDAYLARRALDYLVGFTLSPILWRKLPGARSAGRVQSVALRIICDREREIEAFEPREYWSVIGELRGAAERTLKCRLVRLGGEKIDQMGIGDAAAAEAAAAAVRNSTFTLVQIERKPANRHPAPPFSTSTLQQEAARKLRFTAQHTMRVAQTLYEGKTIGGDSVGLITYMRTDSLSLAGEAIAACRQLIGESYGARYLPDKPRVFKTKAKGAQEAHEAIRPTNLSRRPKDIASALSSDELKLYDLIWKRTMACQMASAVIERTRFDIESQDGATALRATGSVVQFDGFLKLYREGRDEEDEAEDERRLPNLKQGEALELLDVVSNQHFTEPAPRFTEASLVKKLEELGIGRPSTYASTLSVLRDRDYVHMERGKFVPEDKGSLVTAFLEHFFERYVGYDFTAQLERDLDRISAGELDWKAALRAFWDDFHPQAEAVMEVRKSAILEGLNEYLGPHIFPPTEAGVDPRKCPSCEDGRLSIKTSKFGAFVGCSNYPDCEFTRPLSDKKGDGKANGEPMILGHHPDSGLPVSLRDGRFGPYVQIDETKKGEKPPRASIPKDMAADGISLDQALALLSLPRQVGLHPESGKPVTAAIGPYGPYVSHEGKYASLAGTEEVFSVGLNRAVVLLAEAKKGRGKSSQVLKELGPHPDDGETVKLMDGRYGPYVNHKRLNASLPKGTDRQRVSLEQALGWLAERAKKGGGKGRRKRRTS